MGRTRLRSARSCRRIAPKLCFGCLKSSRKRGRDARARDVLAAEEIAPSASTIVMPGLVPGIHVFTKAGKRKDVDGRDKPGHDGNAIGTHHLRDGSLRLRYWPRVRSCRSGDAGAIGRRRCGERRTRRADRTRPRAHRHRPHAEVGEPLSPPPQNASASSRAPTIRAGTSLPAPARRSVRPRMIAARAMAPRIAEIAAPYLDDRSKSISPAAPRVARMPRLPR